MMQDPARIVRRLMRGRLRVLLLSGCLVALFAIFAIVYERGREAQRLLAVARHARAVSVAVWNYDRTAAVEYLGVSIDLENYDRVLVRDSGGEEFVAIAGPPEGGLDRMLRLAGLIPVREVAHPVVFRGQRIGELRVWVRDGAIYTYAYLLLLLLFAQVALTSWLRTVGIKRDLEEYVVAQTADLMRLNEELRQKNAKLQEVDELKTNLLGNVSHELRTPLVSVRGYAELIADGQSGPVTDLQRQQLQTMLRNIDRLGRLIDDLLQYSRMERGSMTYAFRDCDLAALAREAAEQARHAMEQRHLRLETDIPATALLVKGDASRLAQVLGNLLDNAAKFTPAGGKVALAVGTDAQRACFSVSDTGIGIPADKQDKIFERFYRVEGAHDRKYGGTGIGLALCREIVRAHHGTIEVDSMLGAGTTMTVCLPRHQPECLPVA